MSAKTDDFKLGLFVIGAGGILIALLMAFGATRIFQRSTKMETYVATSVQGLKVGAPVLLRGVPVGRVTRIAFSWNIYHVRHPRYVVVEFDVNKSVSLAAPGQDLGKLMAQEVKKGLRARVRSQGLAGAVVLSLEYMERPGQYPVLPAPWKPEHIYVPSAPGPMKEIMTALNDTMAKLKQIDVQRIAAAVQGDVETGGHVLKQIDQANLGGIASNLNSRVTEIGAIGTNVNALVSQVRELSGRLQNFVGSNSLRQGQNLPAIASNLNRALTGLQGSISNLEAKVSKVDLGALNEILESARRAAANLEQVSRQIKEYPSGALFGRPPPPAKGIETK
jgi:phospholipid/cholesterol/gamma-HCH transport system substrate-binding protein